LVAAGTVTAARNRDESVPTGVPAPIVECAFIPRNRPPCRRRA
jgi:hypothetical protein